MKWERKDLGLVTGLCFGFGDMMEALIFADDYLFGNVCGLGFSTFPMDL